MTTNDKADRVISCDGAFLEIYALMNICIAESKDVKGEHTTAVVVMVTGRKSFMDRSPLVE